MAKDPNDIHIRKHMLSSSGPRWHMFQLLEQAIYWVGIHVACPDCVLHTWVAIRCINCGLESGSSTLNQSLFMNECQPHLMRGGVLRPTPKDCTKDGNLFHLSLKALIIGNWGWWREARYDWAAKSPSGNAWRQPGDGRVETGTSPAAPTETILD